ncbi:PREDICTED: uncharacterized protein LOC109582305 [Amphimedon queenslandica]|uniref:DUF19 domain-containing protein n=1 Tax=Amphimedon queenslandica TaxID=400682 RepID=A0AAN0J675_AMPQE|nr:PREDICTED: uncharacterized protein LOC109582305 [Amphimedon queenslandica]|eukprot:XP_019852540.1 PREDICTED: uncharacterized protein LOC109582305 [Amphimedon queenslandica]
MKMLSIFLLCCFIVIASSDGAVTTKKRDLTAVTDWLHKISKRHSSQLEVRQDNTACLNQLQSNYPSYCNFTELSGGLSDLPASSLTDAQLTALNNAYARICVSACIDPVETYYNCLQAVNKDYAITLIRQGVCGQESGDYCEVRYIRQYRRDISAYGRLASNCPSSTSGGISSCSSASSTCLAAVNTFSDRMGCCTEPYLGSGVNSCSGVSVDEPCTGVSSATGLVAPVFVMILSLVGVLVL